MAGHPGQLVCGKVFRNHNSVLHRVDGTCALLWRWLARARAAVLWMGLHSVGGRRHMRGMHTLAQTRHPCGGVWWRAEREGVHACLGHTHRVCVRGWVQRWVLGHGHGRAGADTLADDARARCEG